MRDEDLKVVLLFPPSPLHGPPAISAIERTSSVQDARGKGEQESSPCHKSRNPKKPARRGLFRLQELPMTSIQEAPSSIGPAPQGGFHPRRELSSSRALPSLQPRSASLASRPPCKSMHVVSISGGKDSQATAIICLRNHPDDDIHLVFCDTGNEHELTYAHLDYLEGVFGRKIRRL